MRPQARHLRFFNPTQLTTSPIQVPRERLDPGPPLGRAAAQHVHARRAGAPRAPTRRTRPRSSASSSRSTSRLMHASAGAAIRTSSCPRRRSRARTPCCAGRAGSWLIEDLGSTNGTYADHSYERKTQVALMHGGEVQLGELPPQARELPARLAAAPARAAVPRASATGSPACSSRDHLLEGLDEERRSSPSGPRRR